MILSQLLSGTSSNSSNSSSSADVLAKVTKTMESRNTVAPKLNAALTSDNTKLSGLGKLLNSLTTFQSVAQSFAKNGATQDATQLGGKVTDLVAKYNALNASLNSLRQGDLKWDGALSTVRNQLSGIVTSAQGALTKMGVTVQVDGSLAVDAKKLQSAIDANPAGVAKVFTDGGKGIAEKLASQIQSMVSSNGSIAKETTALNKDISAINVKKAALQKTMTAQAEALAKYYSSQDSSGSSSGTGSSSMPNLFGMLS